MKKYFVSLVFFSFITCLQCFSQEADFVIARNADLTIQAENGTLVTVRDVYSMKSALKRNVQLVNPKTKELIGEAFIRLEGADPDENMYDILKDNPSKFSGTLTIEADGIIVYQKQIVSGVAEPATVTAGRTTGELAGGPCTFRNIHNCVSHIIEGMSWWRYGLCLLSAPACYARQWAFCTFDVCINNTHYPN